MIIHLAADHAGFEHKEAISEWLQASGHEVIDHGAEQYDADDDFVDFMFPAARVVASQPAARGILFGGSGQGEAMAANRVKGIRATVYYGPVAAIGAIDVSGKLSNDAYEIVRLSRSHNDANILSIGARFVSIEDAKQAITIWLDEPFSGKQRYAARNMELDKR